mmetsp:Transcript_14806/g.28046  ORF Transcript_14806/g.28046 Transcript_14806/m.28046 type:complete len:115 (-) Transcript_14806:145-489(-)
MIYKRAIIISIVGLFASPSGAFLVKTPHQTTARTLGALFAQTKKEVSVFVNGKPVPSAKPGQSILSVASKAGVKIPTDCKRGACGTCMCLLNYRKVHACKEKLTAGRVEIVTLQ